MEITQQLINRLRQLAMNPTQEQISDDEIRMIVEGWLEIYPKDSDACIVKYQSLLSILQYLYNRDLIDYGEHTGGRTGRTEKVGEVTVSETYSTISVQYSPWKVLYDNYLNGTMKIPECGNTGDHNGGLAGKVLVGGVDAHKVHQIDSRRQSVNGLGKVANVDRRYPTNSYNSLFRRWRD